MSTSDLLRGAPELARRLRSVRLSAATRFATTRPSPQTAVDAAPGAWVSRFPAPFADVRAGAVDLFEDERIAWGLRTLGGVEGASVLELGPLEGGHSYMAQQAGAARVVAVEANREAFLSASSSRRSSSSTAAPFSVATRSTTSPRASRASICASPAASSTTSSTLCA
jgi:hypothetical protein